MCHNGFLDICVQIAAELGVPVAKSALNGWEKLSVAEPVMYGGFPPRVASSAYNASSASILC